MAFTGTLSQRCSTGHRAAYATLRVRSDVSAAHVNRIHRIPQVLCQAEAETSEATPSASPTNDSWVPVMAPEELPKGVRKEVSIGNKLVLLFWYRSQIYAISSRSPAEGAYSEGFIKAKFTQDYGIVCPTTGSIFSLKDGSIIDWYPTNPVLRAVTPKSGSLPIYPVKLTQDAIMVSLDSAASAMAPTRGGSDSSLESNNVFATQPTVYLQGSDADKADGGALSTALTLTVAISCFAIIATAGTATALFYEDFVLLGAFWALLLVCGGYFAYQYLEGRKETAV